MLASSADISLSNALGLFCAFGSTIVFVTQNIFFKKIMPSKGEGESAAVARAASLHSNDPSGISTSKALSRPKLDKINLLFFSSGMAFLFMVPLWIYSDFPAIWTLWFNPEMAVNTAKPLKPGQVAPSVPYYFFLNGTVHFAQNLLAFAILSSTSPVTYSIASLVKRIAVICLAIVWFNQAVHPVQALGIGLTGIGLFMYNKAKRDVDKGENKVRRMEAIKDGMLPLNNADQRLLDDRSGAATPEYLHEKDVHASPKPEYMDDMAKSPISSTSAIRGHFSLPPPSFPIKMGNNQQHTQGYVVPYPSVSEALPSPPPSQASSPPASAIPHPYQETTSLGQMSRRRPSMDSATRRPVVPVSRTGPSLTTAQSIQESSEENPMKVYPNVVNGFREIAA
jgi:solute carrier family 35 protein E1